MSRKYIIVSVVLLVLLLAVIPAVIIGMQIYQRSRVEEEVWNNALVSGRDPVEAVVHYRAMECFLEHGGPDPGCPKADAAAVAAFRKEVEARWHH